MKGAVANEETGKCERLICEHNKSAFETCQTAVHCACNHKIVELEGDELTTA